MRELIFSREYEGSATKIPKHIQSQFKKKKKWSENSGVVLSLKEATRGRLQRRAAYTKLEEV